MKKNQILVLGKAFNFKKVTVLLHNSLLSMSNGLCERVIDLATGYPKTISLKNSSAREFIRDGSIVDFSFIGINSPDSEAHTEYEIVEIQVSSCTESIFDAEHVRVMVVIYEAVQNITFERSYLIFTDIPAMAVENSIVSEVSSNLYWSHRNGLNEKSHYPDEFFESSVDAFQLQDEVKVTKAVEFQGRTDYTNNLVIERPVKIGTMNGNLILCEHGQAGFFLLQEAPPSKERRDFETHDFRLTADHKLFSCCWGIHPTELIPGKKLQSYRNVIGFYTSGSAGEAVRNYLRNRFPQNKQTAFSVTVNPWGAGGFNNLVNEKFLQEEIEAAAAIGATHYQIDDGWQAGRSLHEIIINNRCVTSDFWRISKPHLPHGFDNLHSIADRHEIELALWVAPSCNKEYRDWKQMADILYLMYQQYGIRMFKIDAVLIRTKEAEDNLEALVKSLRERSAGEIIFNFDTTNGQRPGYFMFLEYGNIFLENRYTFGGGLGYHPEDTLNNLWTLSKYTRTQTLQIEIPSHENVDHDFYSEKKRLQPDLYPPEYWAAVALFANPLLWLAPSTISEKLLLTYRKMMELHLRYRDTIFAGDIAPVGQEPNGCAITGFISHNREKDSGMLLLFREFNSENNLTFDIPQLSAGEYHFETVYDSSETTISRKDTGSFQVTMKSPSSFCLLKYHNLIAQ